MRQRVRTRGGGPGRSSPVVLVPLFVSVLACTSAGERPAADAPVDPPLPSESRVDSLRLSLVVPQELRLGQSMSVSGTLENVSGHDLTLYVRGREPTFDIVVRDTSGREVWRRLHDAVIPAVLRIETLASGRRLGFTHAWDQRSNDGRPVPAGAYDVSAELLLETGVATSAAVRVQIR